MPLGEIASREGAGTGEASAPGSAVQAGKMPVKVVGEGLMSGSLSICVLQLYIQMRYEWGEKKNRLNRKKSDLIRNGSVGL